MLDKEKILWYNFYRKKKGNKNIAPNVTSLFMNVTGQKKSLTQRFVLFADSQERKNKNSSPKIKHKCFIK